MVNMRTAMVVAIMYSTIQLPAQQGSVGVYACARSAQPCCAHAHAPACGNGRTPALELYQLAQLTVAYYDNEADLQECLLRLRTAETLATLDMDLLKRAQTLVQERLKAMEEKPAGDSLPETEQR